METDALRWETRKQKRNAGYCVADGCMSASAVGSDFCAVGDDADHEALHDLDFDGQDWEDLLD